MENGDLYSHDATIRAAVRGAFDAHRRCRNSSQEAQLFEELILLFGNFNRTRNEEILFLRSEVTRLLMLQSAPSILLSVPVP
jgi:hypothetical protein